MEKEHDQFIGLYKNAVPIELCNNFIEWFELIKKSNITYSSREDNSAMPLFNRKDEVVSIPPLLQNEHLQTGDAELRQEYFPEGKFLYNFWPCLDTCFQDYAKEYSMDFPIVSHTFKMHRVPPKQGYHVFHIEQMYYKGREYFMDRVAAWMVGLQPADEGGETEFLHQSKRVKLEQGSILIWPAGFTHMHRGNPPLKGIKYYLTGWFEFDRENATKS